MCRPPVRCLGEGLIGAGTGDDEALLLLIVRGLPLGDSLFDAVNVGLVEPDVTLAVCNGRAADIAVRLKLLCPHTRMLRLPSRAVAPGLSVCAAEVRVPVGAVDVVGPGGVES